MAARANPKSDDESKSKSDDKEKDGKHSAGKGNEKRGWTGQDDGKGKEEEVQERQTPSEPIGK